MIALRWLLARHLQLLIGATALPTPNMSQALTQKMAACHPQKRQFQLHQIMTLTPWCFWFWYMFYFFCQIVIWGPYQEFQHYYVKGRRLQWKWTCGDWQVLTLHWLDCVESDSLIASFHYGWHYQQQQWSERENFAGSEGLENMKPYFWLQIPNFYKIKLFCHWNSFFIRNFKGSFCVRKVSR